MKVTAIIERNNQGKCFIYTKEDFEEFLLTASGETPEDAQEDLYDVIKELKEELGEDKVPEMEFDFQYDAQCQINE